MNLIEIKEAVPRFEDFRFSSPVSWSIAKGENWAVVGANGAGKSQLIDILFGRIVLNSGQVIPDSSVKSGDLIQMSFRDIYSMADCKNMYYQQRWSATEVEEAPLVSSLLTEFPTEKVNEYCKLFHIEDLLSRRLISISSGELRKFLITKTLMKSPKLLVLDNPFIGLDAASRDTVNEMLSTMHQNNGVQVVLVLSNPNDIPKWVNRVLPVCGKALLQPMNPSEFLSDKPLLDKLFPLIDTPLYKLPKKLDAPVPTYEVAIRMDKVSIRYNDHYILKDLDWEVKKGEKWALLGQNGCGKSTLLSLVCADNPQSYANDIMLFDHKRGTGESIWEIKRRIGYLSPDLHTFYLQDIPCLDVVASGFFDSIGLYRRCNDDQREQAAEWLAIFGAEHLASRSFVHISYGEQRVVLLARAFVKQPELLILDEPLHGLDAGKKRRAKEVVERYCDSPNRTLIYVTHYENEIPSCVTLEKRLVKI